MTAGSGFDVSRDGGPKPASKQSVIWFANRFKLSLARVCNLKAGRGVLPYRGRS